MGATQVLTFLIEARTSLEALNQFRDGMKGLESDTGKATKGFAEATRESNGFLNTLKTGVIFGLGNKLIEQLGRIPSVFEAAIKRGVDFNKTLESSKLGLAAVLQTFEGAKFPTLDSALAEAGRGVDLLKIKAKNTSATFQELASSLSSSAGAMIPAGITDLSQQIDLLAKLSVGVKTLLPNADAAQIQQEVRSMLSGQITQDSQLGNALFGTKELKEELKAAIETGQAYAYLTEKLKGFTAAGEQMSNTLEGASSNLGDNLDIISGEVTEPIFESVRQGLIGLNQAISETDIAKAFSGIGEAMGKVVKVGMDAAVWAVKHTDAIQRVIESVAALSEKIVGVAQYFIQHWDQAALLVGSLIAVKLTAPILLFGIHLQFVVGAVGILAGVAARLLPASMAATSTALAGGAASLARFSSLVTLALSPLAILSAGLFGFSIAPFVGQLKLGELTISQWVEMGVYSAQKFSTLFIGFLKNMWVDVSTGVRDGLDGFLTALDVGWKKAMVGIREFAIDAAAVLNKVLPASLEIDTTAWKQSLATAQAGIDDAESQRQLRSAKLQGAASYSREDNDQAMTAEYRDLQSRHEAAYAEAMAANATPSQVAAFALPDSLTPNALTDPAKSGALAIDWDKIHGAMKGTADESKKAAEDAAKLAEQMRANAEAAQRLQLDAVQNRISTVEGDPFLTRVQKNEQLIGLLKQEQAELQKSIDLWQKYVDANKGSADPQVQANVLQYQDKIQGAQQQQIGADQKAAIMTPSGEWEAAWVQWYDRLGTLTTQTASFIQNTLETAVQGVSGAISQAIMGTKTWGQAFMAAGQQILGQLIQMGVQFVLNNTLQLVGHAIQKTGAALGLAIGETATAASVVNSGVQAAAATPAALLTSISSYGIAAAVGLAAIIAAVAAFGGFAEGGYTGSGGKYEPAGVVHKGEYVFSQEQTRRIGAANLERLANAPTGVYAGYATGGLVGSGGAEPLQPTGNGGARSGGGDTKVNVAVVNSRAELHRWAESAEGSSYLGEMIDGKLRTRRL